MGHGLRARALGYTFKLSKDIERDYSQAQSNTTQAWSKNENFFKYLGHCVRYRDSGDLLLDVVSFVYEDALVMVRPGCLPSTIGGDPKERVIFGAGGLNHDMYFAERLCDEVHKKEEITFVEAFALLRNYLYAKKYILGVESMRSMGYYTANDVDDPILIENGWAGMGVPAEVGKLKTTGMVALCASGTTYYALYSLWKAFTAPGEAVRAFEIYGVRVPDIFSYITSRGISYKGVSSYKINEQTKVLFGGEFVAYGDSAREFSIGIWQQLGEERHNVSYKGLVTVGGKGSCAEAAVKIPLLGRFFVNVGGNIYSRNSLLGERHSPNLKKEYGANAFCSVSYGY